MTACARFGLWRTLSSAFFFADDAPPPSLAVPSLRAAPSLAFDGERRWLRRAVVAQVLALAAQVVCISVRVRRAADERALWTQAATLPLHDAREPCAWLWTRTVAVRARRLRDALRLGLTKRRAVRRSLSARRAALRRRPAVCSPLCSTGRAPLAPPCAPSACTRRCSRCSPRWRRWQTNAALRRE